MYLLPRYRIMVVLGTIPSIRKPLPLGFSRLDPDMAHNSHLTESRPLFLEIIAELQQAHTPTAQVDAAAKINTRGSNKKGPAACDESKVGTNFDFPFIVHFLLPKTSADTAVDELERRDRTTLQR